MSANDQEGSGPKRAALRVVRGGGAEKRTLAGLTIKVVDIDDAPRDVEAVAVEDDSYFVIGADPGFTEPTEHPIRTWTAVHETEPANPGSVHVREGRPLRLHAVVHDLSRDPTWEVEWVESALAGILREVERRGLRSLALPVLGAVHGRLPVERFVELLEAVLAPAPPRCLVSLVLLAPEGTTRALEASLGD